MCPSPNRARLTVDLGGNWRLCAGVLPRGMRALGTVARGVETGALALVEATGIYVQINAGVMRTLDQRKVQAAVDAARAGSQGGPGRGQGRRSQDGATGLRRRTVSLDDATWAAAKVLGDGDASCGLRRAVSLGLPQPITTPTPQTRSAGYR